MKRSKKKRFGCLIKLIFLFVIFCGITPYIVTNQLFIKYFVIPKVESATGYKIDCDVNLNFMNSFIEVSNLKISGKDGLDIKGDKVYCSYNLEKIISGTISITKVELENVTVSMVEKAIEKQKKQSAANSSSVSEGESSSFSNTSDKKGTHGDSLSIPNLDLSDISISNLNFKYKSVDGKSISLIDFSLMLDKLKPGETTNLSFGGKLDINYGASMKFKSDALSGSLTYITGNDMLPEKLNLMTSLKKVKGSIQGKDISGRALSLKGAVNRSGQDFNINDFSLTEMHGLDNSSKIELKGDISCAPLAVNLDITALPVSTELLNLIGSLVGDYNFGESKLYYKGHLEYKEGQYAKARGKMFVNDFSISVPKIGSIDLPILKVTLEHDISTDLSTSTLFVSKLSLKGVNGRTKIVDIQLVKPSTLNYGKGAQMFSNNPPIVDVALDDLSLTIIKPFIPNDVPLNINDGMIDLNGRFALGSNGKTVISRVKTVVDGLSLKYGDIKLNNFNLNTDLSLNMQDFSGFPFAANLKINSFDMTQINAFIKGKPLRPCLLSSDIKIAMDDPSNVKIKPSNIAITRKGDNAARIVFTGNYNIKDSNSEFTVVLDDFNQRLLDCLGTLAKGVPLKTFTLKGKSIVKLDAKSSDTFISGKLICRDTTFKPDSEFNANTTYNVGASYNVGITPKLLSLNKVKLQIQDGKQLILDTNLNGKVPLPIKSGPISLFVGSHMIDLDKVLLISSKKKESKRSQNAPHYTTASYGNRTLVNEYKDGLSTNANVSNYPALDEVESPAKSESEPAPIDLGGLNLKLGLDLENVSYSGMMLGAKGDVTVYNNVVQAKPLDVSINGALINLLSKIDLGNPNGIKYSLIGRGEDIVLTQYLKSYVGKTKHEPSLEVAKFNIDINGQGVTRKNIEKNISADLKIDMTKISLPVELQDSKIFKLLFGALKSVGALVGKIPIDLSSQLSNVTAVLDRQKNLEFDKAVADISVRNREVIVNSIQFDGEDIHQIRFKGSGGFDKQFKLNTVFDLGAIQIPIPISGTYDSPHFDTSNFLSQFMTGNLNKVKNKTISILKSPGNAIDILSNKEKRDNALHDLFGDFMRKKKKKKDNDGSSRVKDTKDGGVVPVKADNVQDMQQRDEPKVEKRKSSKDAIKGAVEDMILDLF